MVMPPAPPGPAPMAPPAAIACCMFSAIALKEGSSDICLAISLMEGSSSISLILLMSKGAPGGMPGMPPGGAPPRPPKPGGRSPAPVFEGGVDVGSGLGQRSEVVRLLLRDPKPENQRKGNRLPRGESRAARAHYEAKGRSRDRMGHERGRTSHVNRLRVGVFVRVDRRDRGSAVLSAGRDCDMAIRSWPLIGGDDEILLEKKQHSLISHKKV